MNTDPVLFLGICPAIFGLLMLLLLPRDEFPRRLASMGMFALGMTYTAYAFLSKNPDLLESVEENIALTLIGMIIATLSVIRFIRK